MTKIVSTQGVLGGKPRIEGHRISVLDVAELLDSGLSVEAVSDELVISVEAVEAARRYAEEHPEELAEAERERRQFHERLTEERKRSA